MKKILLALWLGLAAATSFGATVMLKGPVLTITNATNATPIVLTTASNTLIVNDWVQVLGVQGNAAANGIWQCSAVTATSCTLSGSAGGGNYTQGGALTPLGLAATGVSAGPAGGGYFDLTKCDKAYVYIWSPGGATATVNIEATAQSNPATLNIGPTTPNFVLVAVTNPTATGSYYSVPVMSFIRVNVAAWTSGSVFAVLEAYRAGSRVW